MKCTCGSTDFTARVMTSYNTRVSSAAGYPTLVMGTEGNHTSDVSGPFVCVSCGNVYLDIEDREPTQDDGFFVRRCSCGNTRFSAKQKCYHDVVVNGDNAFIRDDGISDSENPYGTYSCTQCGKEYEELDKLIVADFKNADAAQKIKSAVQSALHIEWDDLGFHLSELLSAAFGRDVSVEAIREEYYYWKASIDVPLTPGEQVTLFALAQVSDDDREQNQFDEFPIMEITERICNKLMGKLLSFELELTRADDEGVWFIGSAITASAIHQKRYFELPLPNGMTFTAKTDNEEAYPSVFISLKQPDGSDDLICFAEYNRDKPTGKEICIGAYAHNQEEPAYYESYSDAGNPSENE